MSVIRWLVMQEVCRRFEFARHFESHLARPPPFYMRMRMTTSDEHSIVTMLHSISIIFSTYSFNATYSRTYVLPTAYMYNHTFVSAHAYSTCTTIDMYYMYIYIAYITVYALVKKMMP